MKQAKIYILRDPRNGDIRYVGKTNQKLSYRLNAHMQEKSQCHRVNWLNQLRTLGLKPGIEVVEFVQGDYPWQECERFWIKYFRMHGHKLTNNTSGGDGVPDLPMETRQRMRQVWLGRKHKPETIIKLSNASKGRKKTEAMKDHMRRIMAGRAITWGDKLAEGIRKFADNDVSSIIARLANGEKVKDLATEYGVHRTTISKIKKGTYYDRYRSRPET